MNTSTDLTRPDTIQAEPLPYLIYLNQQSAAQETPRDIPQSDLDRLGDLRSTPHDINLPPIDVPALRERSEQKRKPTYLQEYIPAPYLPLGRVPLGANIWRIEMYGPDPSAAPLGFDIHDDALIGRGTHAHIRLDGPDAEAMGVSRLHAMFRPTRMHLILVDMGSCNGTCLNGMPLAKAAVTPVGDGDVITFGGLSFVVRIVEHPPDRTYHPTCH